MFHITVKMWVMPFINFLLLWEKLTQLDVLHQGKGTWLSRTWTRLGENRHGFSFWVCHQLLGKPGPVTEAPLSLVFSSVQKEGDTSGVFPKLQLSEFPSPSWFLPEIHSTCSIIYLKTFFILIHSALVYF